MKKKLGLIDEISEKLFTEFKAAMALNPKSKPGKRPTEKDIKADSAAALDTFYRRAEEERNKHRLGIVGRARVAFGLQKRLLEAGYAPALVKQVLLAMLAAVFVGSRR